VADFEFVRTSGVLAGLARLQLRSPQRPNVGVARERGWQMWSSSNLAGNEWLFDQTAESPSTTDLKSSAFKPGSEAQAAKPANLGA